MVELAEPGEAWFHVLAKLARHVGEQRDLPSGFLQLAHPLDHAPVDVLSKTADGLPGFGIVAAVLGIVITMAAIDGPVEEIGHKVGAALVGTFLGILASYGFLGPMAARMDVMGHCELAFFKTISSIVLAMINNCAPKVAVEQARRGVATENRPTRPEMEELFKQVDSGG